MKVAIVLNTSWNIYNFRLNLINTLIGRGIEVHAIAPEDKYSQSLIDLGCHYHRVKMDSRGVNPIKDTALIIELYGIYKKIKPDVILHYTIKPNIYGTIAASLLKIPVVNNVCGLGTVFLKNNLISKVAIMLYKIAFRFPKKVFFQNIEDKQLFIQKNIINQSIAEVIPGSGVDLEKFKPQKNIETNKGKPFTFLIISRLIYDKGILEYVDAVKKLKMKGIDAKFQVLGPKDPKHRRGIPVEIIDGWINNDIFEYLGTTNDVRSFINEADCIVLPSYREGTPRTLLEAACMGKPIVATNVAGCNSVVEHGYNGFLCKVKDANDLADKMENILSLQDHEIQLMSKNGQQKIQDHYGVEKVVNKYIKVINEI